MNPTSDSDARPARHPHDKAATREPVADVPDDGEVEQRDSTGGPTTLEWWLDDGPDSPIAADIEEPGKHL